MVNNGTILKKILLINKRLTYMENIELLNSSKYDSIIKINHENKLVFSIGYEGINFDYFLELLNKNKITQVIDIRENSFSWKMNFRNKIFENNLKKNNIKYVHISDLGAPKYIRKEIKINNNPKKFFHEYKILLSRNNDSFEYLMELSGHEKTVILCVEKDYKLCHRKAIIDKLRKHNFSVKNL
jgi:uncharacterized protein (DUF488 family)